MSDSLQAYTHLEEGDLVAGVDEAGRGPLAGPVFAAAVILDKQAPIAGLADSKKLSHQQRLRLYQSIRSQALCYAIGTASVAEIDEINILQASLLAMRRAVVALTQTPSLVLVDGNRTPTGLAMPSQAIIKGDSTIAAISAASILAKVERDALCQQLDRLYPNYGFAQHKGYGTRQHLEMLQLHGPCPAHRRSFAPVRKHSQPK